MNKKVIQMRDEFNSTANIYPKIINECIDDETIEEDKLKTNSVTTSKIKDGNVTEIKLSDEVKAKLKQDYEDILKFTIPASRELEITQEQMDKVYNDKEVIVSMPSLLGNYNFLLRNMIITNENNFIFNTIASIDNNNGVMGNIIFRKDNNQPRIIIALWTFDIESVPSI